MRKMIIDTDTASDDAVAIVMALQTPDIEVIGITVVAGNMPVKQASINARYSAQIASTPATARRCAAKRRRSTTASTRPSSATRTAPTSSTAATAWAR